MEGEGGARGGGRFKRQTLPGGALYCGPNPPSASISGFTYWSAGDTASRAASALKTFTARRPSFWGDKGVRN